MLDTDEGANASLNLHVKLNHSRAVRVATVGPDVGIVPHGYLHSNGQPTEGVGILIMRVDSQITAVDGGGEEKVSGGRNSGAKSVCKVDYTFGSYQALVLVTRVVTGLSLLLMSFSLARLCRQILVLYRGNRRRIWIFSGSLTEGVISRVHRILLVSMKTMPRSFFVISGVLMKSILVLNSLFKISPNTLQKCGE
jgi:hypothetical protein